MTAALPPRREVAPEAATPPGPARSGVSAAVSRSRHSPTPRRGDSQLTAPGEGRGPSENQREGSPSCGPSPAHADRAGRSRRPRGRGGEGDVGPAQRSSPAWSRRAKLAPGPLDASALRRGPPAPAASLGLSGSAPPACSWSPRGTTPSPSPHPNPSTQGPACPPGLLRLRGQGLVSIPGDPGGRRPPRPTPLRPLRTPADTRPATRGEVLPQESRGRGWAPEAGSGDGTLGRSLTQRGVSGADSASHCWDRHSSRVVINNPRPCSVFYETLCLPFNELRVTNRKVTPRKWGD